MPEQPQKKASFLTFPKASENVFEWHGSIAMLPNIVVLEAMVYNQIKYQSDNSEYRKGMNSEGASANFFPGSISASYCEQIGEARKK